MYMYSIFCCGQYSTRNTVIRMYSAQTMNTENVCMTHTVCCGVRLNTVDNVRVSSEHVHDLPCPLVPQEHSATVTATHHPVISKEVGLLDLHVNTDTHTHTHTHIEMDIQGECQLIHDLLTVCYVNSVASTQYNCIHVLHVHVRVYEQYVVVAALHGHCNHYL